MFPHVKRVVSKTPAAGLHRISRSAMLCDEFASMAGALETFPIKAVAVIVGSVLLGVGGVGTFSYYNTAAAEVRASMSIAEAKRDTRDLIATAKDSIAAARQDTKDLIAAAKDSIAAADTRSSALIAAINAENTFTGKLAVAGATVSAIIAGIVALSNK